MSIIRYLITIVALLPIAKNCLGEQKAEELFPKTNFTSNWQLVDSVKVYPGDELFTYMDGGAEVYIEYGFQKIAVAQYLVSGNEQVQCEIYQMSDSTGAYGNYTFYITDGVNKIDIGTDGVYNDYYLAFWKGPFLAVISSPSPTDSTLNRIKVLAAAVSKNITVLTKRPLIVEKFIKVGIDVLKIKFFKGRNGLNNFYRFVPGNTFEIKNAVAFSKGDTKIVVNEYDNSDKAKIAINDAQQKILKAASNKNVESIENGFRYNDSGKNNVICIVYNRYIIVSINDTILDNASLKEITGVLN